jgi:asparagine synthase (glutamine-hydrolysing)
MGLCAVVGTQLWHHLYMGGGLCELPTWQSLALAENSNVNV